MEPKRNILRLHEEQSLWRIFSSQRLLDVFTKRQITLISPHKWDDPFEDFLRYCTVPGISSSTFTLGQLTRKFVGQCWSAAPDETDASWRIYAPGAVRAVRAQVRVTSLFDCIYDPRNPSSSYTCFLGTVRYLTHSEVLAEFAALSFPDSFIDDSQVSIAETLLVKRIEFAHEQEVRLLFIKALRGRARLEHFRVQPAKLFEELVLDPRWSRSEAAAYTRALRSAGFRGPIRQSELYRVPELMEVHDTL